MQSLLSPTLTTVRPITTASLAQFQRFLLGQIDQLQKSSMIGKSTSNVVAVQNSEGVLKQSIINFYIQERAAKKDRNNELIASEIAILKQNHNYMKQCIEDTIRQFYKGFMLQFQVLGRQMNRLQHQNSLLKTKLKEMSKTNKQLAEQNKKIRKDLIQWQQAKQRRRSKQLTREEPSIQKIQQLIQKKMLTDDLLSHMTPLKQFNMQTFINKKIPSFNFATSMAQSKSITNTDKKLRTSSISDVKNLNPFTTSIDVGEGMENQRRKSKQKLKIVSIQP